MADVKITKRDRWAQVRDIVEKCDAEQKEDILKFIDREVELLAAKAVKAAERAANKKAEGDALRERVQGLLTDELQTIDDITALIGDENISKHMVTARLTQLVKIDVAARDTVKVGTRKVAAYKLKGEIEPSVNVTEEIVEE